MGSRFTQRSLISGNSWLFSVAPAHVGITSVWTLQSPALLLSKCLGHRISAAAVLLSLHSPTVHNQELRPRDDSQWHYLHIKFRTNLMSECSVRHDKGPCLLLTLRRLMSYIYIWSTHS